MDNAKNNRKIYVLNGLDCPNCAEKINSRVNSHSGVKEATVSFVKKELAVEFNSTAGAEEEIIALIKKLEPDIVVAEKGKNTAGDDNKSAVFDIIRIAVTAALFVVGLIGISTPVSVTAYITAYIIIGYDVVLSAVKNVFRGEIFDENMLMTIATAGAVVIGEYPEAVAVMLFYCVGEFFQSLSVRRSRRSIADLMNIRPDYANVKRNGETVRIRPEEAEIGEIIVVKAGERIPLDGKVVSGTSDLDMSPLNGESAPRAAAAADEVYGGALCINGALEIAVTKTFGQSTAAKILELVENAADKKSKTEKFITKFSKVYTPIVVLAAVIVGGVIPAAFSLDFSEWIYKGLVFLIISCPCALVVSIPLSYFCGIGKASREGILVKGSNYFEALSSAKTVVFDKTGTLTKGSFIISEIRTNGISESEFMKTLSYAEYYSTHPLAAAVRGEERIDESLISDYTEIAGEGISVRIGGKAVLAGNARLMKRHGIPYPEIGETLIYAAVDGEYKGAVIFADEFKDTSLEAVAKLKKIGVNRVVMLTGDNKGKAKNAAERLGISECYSELLPQGKSEMLEHIKKDLRKNETVIFVGDGINDAPVLAMADVGIAMGGLGSDSAVEAADAVIMNDEPIKVCTAIDIARRTKRKAQQNIALAIGVKLAVQILSLFWLVDMWAAVCADVGVTLVAVLNAMRLIAKSRKDLPPAA